MHCVLASGYSTLDADQVTTLRNHVAELEGVVCGLGNKPQPQWVDNALAAITASGTPAPNSSTPSTPERRLGK
jgi:hypothetical protein